MVLMQTASKWGVGYRFRYYLDGKRVSEREADALFADHPNRKQTVSEPTDFGWRTKWELV